MSVNDSRCANSEHVLCGGNTLTCFCAHGNPPTKGCSKCKFGAGKMTEPEQRQPDWCAYCGYANPPYVTTQISPALCVQCDFENAHVEEPKYVDGPREGKGYRCFLEVGGRRCTKFYGHVSDHVFSNKTSLDIAGERAAKELQKIADKRVYDAAFADVQAPKDLYNVVMGEAKQTKEIEVSGGKLAEQFCRHGKLFTCVECSEFNQAVFKAANPHLIVGVDHSDAVDATAFAFIHARRSGDAVKFDESKHRYDLIPPLALDCIAEVFTYGANKYADRNWEKGMRYGRLFAAAMRHLWAFWRGEEYDSESGLQHLAHAAVCVIMILDYRLTEAGEDDRPCTKLTRSNPNENKS